MTRLKEGFVQKVGGIVPLSRLHALEIGCGEGDRSVFLAKRVKSLVAIDPERSSVATAKKINSAPNISYSFGRAEKLPFAGRFFDAVFFTLSLHHVPPRKMATAISEAIRVTTPGGWIIILEPGNRGSLFEAELDFGAFDDDERWVKAQAYSVILADWRWREVAELWDETIFQLESVRDFKKNMAPTRNIKQLASFLKRNHFQLTAERRINIFRTSQ